ncbi:MAG: SDR family NAD(P)-dependent oxidoreductase, partial [Myxococcales bacterium]
PPLSGAYSASKHAVVAVSEALAQDLSLRRSPIGVSVLCPAWVATRLLESAPGADPVLRALLAQGRPAEEIAERTVRAVRVGEFYVLTHPEMAPAVRRRAEQILAGRAPKAVPFSLPRSREG